MIQALIRIGLGAGGGKPESAHVATIVYTSIYAVFTLTGFFGGSIMNTIGPKWTMSVSSGRLCRIYHAYPFRSAL